jgi:Phosphoesterase family
MIITYDEGGGFFDHVSPIELKTTVVESTCDPFPTLGIRVPALIVSPLVKPGGLFKGLLDHTSILKFIGQKFGDDGHYSSEVNNRPKVGSVLDVLSDSDCRVNEPRKEIPEPPPFEPVDSFVRGRSYHPATPSEEAFAYALKRMLDDPQERDRAKTKFPELGDFFSAHENLLWELARVIVKAKGCRFEDCERNLRIFLDSQEKKLEEDSSCAAVAYANLGEMIDNMVAEARDSGSFVIDDAAFLNCRPDSLFGKS